MRRVPHDRPQTAGLQDIVHRLPVRSGGLHRDVVHPEALQPVRQTQQRAGIRRELPDLVLAWYLHTHRDLPLVHVDPCAALMHQSQSHRPAHPLPRQLLAVGATPRFTGVLPYVLTLAGGDNVWCSTRRRGQTCTRALSTKENSTSASPTASAPDVRHPAGFFMPRGAGPAGMGDLRLMTRGLERYVRGGAISSRISLRMARRRESPRGKKTLGNHLPLQDVEGMRKG